MLFDDYAAKGLFHNANFTGTADSKTCVYRGDLVLEADFSLPPNQRRPPSLTLTQAVAVAVNGKLTMLSGALQQLSGLPSLVERFGADFDPKLIALIFVRNLDKPIEVDLGNTPFLLVPFDDTMIWNELLDLLAIEKGDLKSLSAEEKVLALQDELRGFRPKYPKLSWEEAQTRTIERAPVDRGPV